VCGSIDLLDLKDAELDSLIEYTKKAARPLSVVSGPIHVELI
jgi:hypothetical protein